MSESRGVFVSLPRQGWSAWRSTPDKCSLVTSRLEIESGPVNIGISFGPGPILFESYPNLL